MYTNDGICFPTVNQKLVIQLRIHHPGFGAVFSHVSYMLHDTILLKWHTLLSVQQHFSDSLQFYCKLRLQL